MTIYICVFKSAIFYNNIVVKVAESGFSKIRAVDVNDIL